jgi:hypothetical protein
LFTRYDSRLQYYNLKKERSQNALTLEEVYKLWIPFLVFDNTENNEATKGTEDTEVTITRYFLELLHVINSFYTHPEKVTYKKLQVIKWTKSIYLMAYKTE